MLSGRDKLRVELKRKGVGHRPARAKRWSLPVSSKSLQQITNIISHIQDYACFSFHAEHVGVSVHRGVLSVFLTSQHLAFFSWWVFHG